MWIDDIVKLLEDAGVGTFGTDIFASTLHSVPMLPSGEATIQIIETGGTAPENIHNEVIKPAYRQPGAQITTRAGDYVTAHNKAAAAYSALFVRNQTINSSWYQWIKALQEPFDSGVDGRGQVMVRFNVIGKKTE